MRTPLVDNNLWAKTILTIFSNPCISYGASAKITSYSWRCFAKNSKTSALIAESLAFNDKYFERVIHHELFHIINDGFKDLFDEDEWKKFNEPNFKYADCSTCSKKLGLDTYENTIGFFTEYSMTTPSEDMAEVYSHLITGNYKNSNDIILNKKINFIKDILKEVDSNFVF